MEPHVASDDGSAFDQSLVLGRLARLEAEVAVFRDISEDGFSALSKTLTFMSGLLHRLALDEAFDVDDAMNRLGRLRREVDAAWDSWRLISSSMDGAAAALENVPGNVGPTRAEAIFARVRPVSPLSDSAFEAMSQDGEGTQARSGAIEPRLLIVTTTTVETDAVLSAFEVDGESLQPRPGPHTVSYDLGVHSGAAIALVECSEMGSSKQGGSQETVKECAELWDPSWIVCVGICFGMNRHDQRIGDVVISDAIQPYESVKIGTGSEMSEDVENRNPLLPASRTLVSRLSCRPVVAGRRVTVGIMLSGDKLIDNRAFRERLARQFPRAIAGDMEGEGVANAAAMAKVDWVVVKALCDWADGTKAVKKSSRQQTAAAAAAGLVAGAVRRGLFQHNGTPS